VKPSVCGLLSLGAQRDQNKQACSAKHNLTYITADFLLTPARAPVRPGIAIYA
jgi:hypothetical protein